MAKEKNIHIKIPVVNTPAMRQAILISMATLYLIRRDFRSSSGEISTDVALCLIANLLSRLIMRIELLDSSLFPTPFRQCYSQK